MTKTSENMGSSSGKLLRLNLGAGSGDPKNPPVLNCDLYPGPNIDVVFDVQQPWPFDDNSVGDIMSSHMLEHLPNPVAFFEQAYRCLVDGGLMMLRLPVGNTDAGICDITHVKQWLPGSFCFLQPGYGEYIRNPQHRDNQPQFSIEMTYLRINPKLRRLLWPLWRRWGTELVNYLHNGYHEQLIFLRCLKTAQSIETWQRERGRPNAVPVVPCMYRHEYEGRELRPNEPMEFVYFAAGSSEFGHERG